MSDNATIDWNDTIKKEARGINDDCLSEVQDIGEIIMSTTLVVSPMMMILPIQYIAYAQINNTRVALTSPPPPTPSSAATTTNSGNNITTFNLEVSGKSYPIFLACFIYCWSL
jgi:hypothetical protein